MGCCLWGRTELDMTEATAAAAAAGGLNPEMKTDPPQGTSPTTSDTRHKSLEASGDRKRQTRAIPKSWE